MNQTPQPCEGGCGRLLRPKRAPLSQYPGTVRLEARGRCQPCNAPLADPSYAKGPEPRKGQCTRCLRPTRGRGMTAEDFPGTVLEHSVDLCHSCWRHLKHGIPKTREASLIGWGECGECQRQMRPHNTTKANAPGTVKHHGRGLCVTCHRRAENPEKPAGPLIVGVTATEQEAAREAPEPVVEVTDPGLLRLRAEREERKRKAALRDARVAQEAARRRFLATRKRTAA